MILLRYKYILFERIKPGYFKLMIFLIELFAPMISTLQILNFFIDGNQLN